MDENPHIAKVTKYLQDLLDRNIDASKKNTGNIESHLRKIEENQTAIEKLEKEKERLLEAAKAMNVHISEKLDQ